MGRVKVNLTLDASRLAAPLREAGRYAAFPGLTPSVELSGTMWIVRVQALAAITGEELRDRIGSLADQRDALTRALDIPVDGV
jgi:toxin CcdB